jgi:glycosyltransferase involved in cell wall biosynthesis
VAYSFRHVEGFQTVRIVVHDYSGHPFQVQLSRELAWQGHQVLHLYSASFPTPKGPLQRRPDDPPSFSVEGIGLDEPFDKYSHFARRRRQEIRYGKKAARRIAEYRPDLLLSGNTPLDAQSVLQSAARELDAKFVFWLQDVYSAGIGACLRKKHFPLASAVGTWYSRLEGRLLRSSDAVVIVSPDFRPALNDWDVMPGRIHTIPNWAPWNELRARPPDNAWSREHGLAGKFVLLYAGTLGMKHNPRLLVDLAEAMQGYPDAMVAVVSEGFNADWLGTEASARGLGNLKTIPLQAWERMPEVLSAGSVLLALLDAEAGAFSVPSKVLSCMCVGRPLLVSVPSHNLAAHIVSDSGAGLVTPAGDSAALISAAQRLYGDPVLRTRCGANAVAWARNTFDIRRIAARFDAVFEVGRTPSSAPAPRSGSPRPSRPTGASAAVRGDRPTGGNMQLISK